ncbi:MAG: MBL fold metallo-hydrolase [Deltaproteobacteria bacterium]|nr:MBL fold metallo-hydrolase [Deltaproteobacteria bacterium]
MELFVLGSGSGVPNPERGPSGLALSSPPHLLLLDGGGGSLWQMARLGLDYRRVDLFGLTHFHPDHASDLVPFLFALNYGSDLPRTRPLHLLGPPGLHRLHHLLQEAFGRWIEARTYPLQFHEMEEGRLSLPGLEVESRPMRHSTAAVGFRVEARGRSLVYSGDTDYCENIILLGREADLLILECSFPDERKVEGHLTPSLAGRIAREAGARRLLLTHFYPVFQGVDIAGECRREYSGPILLAEDGMKVLI